MKRASTLFLKGVVSLIGLGALAVCIFWLPEMAHRDAVAHPETSYLQYPFLIGAYLLALPFFAALYQTLRLLTFIDKSQVFSEMSVNALCYIKYCGIAISITMVLGMIVGTVILFGEDIAGVIMLGIIVTFASAAVATFAAVLQKLLQNAIDIKSENDLTV